MGIEIGRPDAQFFQGADLGAPFEHDLGRIGTDHPFRVFGELSGGVDQAGNQARGQDRGSFGKLQMRAQMHPGRTGPSGPGRPGRSNRSGRFGPLGPLDHFGPFGRSGQFGPAGQSGQFGQGRGVTPQQIARPRHPGHDRNRAHHPLPGGPQNALANALGQTKIIRRDNKIRHMLPALTAPRALPRTG